MICKVISTVEKYELLKNVKSVAVGLSGGADSVCLLDVLSKLKEKYGIIVKAAHINHNIRGEEALRDEDFVRALCESYGVELEVFSVDVKALAREKGIGEEECGREVRYECFARMNCDAVAVAHTLSDSIETMLFNLARGTALKGLCGIPAMREPNIIRPLIECTRSEIEEYCKENSLSYVTDSTNLSCDYTRNHIRHRLIPDVRHINGGFEKNISRCMESLREDCDYLDEKADELYESCLADGGYSVSMLRESHAAIRKRVLARILKLNMHKDVDKRHVELFDKAIRGECSKIEIGTRLYISVSDDIVSISQEAVSLDEWQCTFEKGRAETPCGTYLLEKAEDGSENVFDASVVKGEISISSRRPGDSFTFDKRKITKSLKKLFNEMKIPLEKRNSIAVLHDGERVIWVEGVGINSQYLPKDITKELLSIKKEG